jgi:glycosyltransferase involved in cell wall biosynthesis
MTIACLISSLSRKAGGLHHSVRRLSQSLGNSGSVQIHVLGMADEYTQEDHESWAPLQTHAFPAYGPRQFGCAPGLTRKLLELNPDIVLVHGLWMYPTLAALAWHRRTRRPFIVNPHGMLDPWAVNNCRWKKRLAGFFYENRSLRKAACIRALCPPEAEAIRACGLRNPICVIPNGIDLPDGPSVHPAPWQASVEPGGKVLLYLGRIHPKKGLPNLLRAWAVAEPKGWNLAIAGWSQNGHEQELKDLARRLGLLNCVCFPGPQFGDAKAATYHHADAFVLPSLSEGLPLVVLEAWASQLPVLMTLQCNLPEGFETQAALRIQPEPDSIVQGLKTLFSMTPAGRGQMGARGRALAAQRFNWPEIGGQMLSVCRWVLGGEAKPACVGSP